MESTSKVSLMISTRLDPHADLVLTCREARVPGAPMADAMTDLLACT
jgi:hypothetical protein